MSNQKNVLLISTDHWSAELLGCVGKSNIMTPTLDTLANNGLHFTNFYSECPVCIPARRTLMTGLTPKTHGDRVYSDTLTMPNVKTLAQTFRDAGYQAYGVGKLHVYPQRNRIGFDDVSLQEEGRYEFGCVDDYQYFLGDKGAVGQEFMHCMGNNTYYTRPWHLSEELHPTNWATKEMMRQIKRKDPTRPAFYYISYQFPHPPLVPLQAYLDMYDMDEIEDPILGDYVDDSYIMKAFTEDARDYSEKEIKLAKRAFYAQCTHIDHQIRLLIGTLRESDLLDNTIIVFTSDHGDMLFNNNMVAKRCFYERSTNIPLIISGQALGSQGTDNRLGCLADVMPTLLDICGIKIPASVEGISLVSQEKREILYGEVGEGLKATRMVHDGRFKLIYYPCGNIVHMFDLENDPQELKNIANDSQYLNIRSQLEGFLIGNLYKEDLTWVKDGKLVGIPEPEFKAKKDFGLYNQRGFHWPAPSGYENMGKNG